MANFKFADSVFINCPFDSDFAPLFEAIVFTVTACGFVPRSSYEEADGGDMRLIKIARLIDGSRFGIHDLSRIELDADRLPRFNMPFELGIDWTLKHYGTKQQRLQKRLLLLENQRYTLTKCLSDIAGQDAVHHDNDPGTLIRAVRQFLVTASQRRNIPGDVAIAEQFRTFAVALPAMCTSAGLDRIHLQYVEYVQFTRTWLKAQNAAAPATV